MAETLEPRLSWVGSASREATPQERQTLRRLRAELEEALTPEAAASYATPEARQRFAVVRLGLAPSAPDTKLTETFDFSEMVEEAFEAATSRRAAA